MMRNMKIFRSIDGVVLENDNVFKSINVETSWNDFIDREGLYDFLMTLWDNGQVLPNGVEPSRLLAPIGSQEIWAAGVTYHSSRLARMEESRDAGGGDFYSRVYGADRPEIFFKATAARTVGPGKEFRIRNDSTWDVPEPELTLFATSTGKVVGYTIGNDVSSRSIEGENPLYLPQAKTFDRCACLGPCLYVPREPLAKETKIKMSIERAGDEVFSDVTTLEQMKRTPEELISFLFRETSFPGGVFLMTGTGIVPGTDFTLMAEDKVSITIDSIGTLINFVGH
jgi:2-dehydro-3-deoxy-D-arabinonate dehydratase